MTMIGIIALGIWMLLIVSDIWSIKKRLDRLEWEINKLCRSGVEDGNDTTNTGSN